MILFYSVTILIIVIDQLSKYWVRTHLQIGDTIKVVNGVLHVTCIKNSGAACSWFQGYGRLSVLVDIIVTIIYIYMLKKGYINGKLLVIGTAFSVGRAIGKANDRVLFNQ